MVGCSMQSRLCARVSRRAAVAVLNVGAGKGDSIVLQALKVGRVGLRESVVSTDRGPHVIADEKEHCEASIDDFTSTRFAICYVVEYGVGLASLAGSKSRPSRHRARPRAPFFAPAGAAAADARQTQHRTESVSVHAIAIAIAMSSPERSCSLSPMGRALCNEPSRFSRRHCGYRQLQYRARGRYMYAPRDPPAAASRVSTAVSCMSTRAATAARGTPEYDTLVSRVSIMSHTRSKSIIIITIIIIRITNRGLCQCP